MDFGALDGLVCSENHNSSNISMVSGCDVDPKRKWCGSGGGFFRQERSVSAAAHEDEWRDMKMAKISQDNFSKAMLSQQQRSNSGSVCPDAQNMLSFSSPSTQTITLPYYARTPTDYGGVRGPFTPSQWMELEHQALIYKYITVNAPIPSNLLIPIRKALETAAFSAYPSPHLRPNTFGWGGFHLGFSNNADPEPGRCRRTDGKKWRCSRDAVADQKYCERHMNRGRHRSRKPVEGQTGQSVPSGPATKLSPPATAATTASSTVIRHLQPAHNTPNPTQSSKDNRGFLNKANMGSEKIQDGSIGLKQNQVSEFGLVCSDSLLNPMHKTEPAGGPMSQNSLHRFMDEWQPTDRTHLSISIPLDPTSSSDERLSFSPLRMGLGTGGAAAFNCGSHQRQPANWFPISWEASMGGPLGEVLHHNTHTNPNSSPSALNLMTDGWDRSPRRQTAVSPTGVLQKTTGFGSLSNSSTGSSPRAENRPPFVPPLL